MHRRGVAVEAELEELPNGSTGRVEGGEGMTDVLADAIKRSGKLKIEACFTRSEAKRKAFDRGEIDAEGKPRFTGDVAIDGGKITAVGEVAARGRDALARIVRPAAPARPRA